MQKYIDIHICIHAFSSLHNYILEYIQYIRICFYTHVEVYIHRHTSAHTCMVRNSCMYVRVCMYVCMYVCR